MNWIQRAIQTYLVYMTMAFCCLMVSSLQARNVGLFYNAEYLDILDGDLFAEASNLKSTLEYLGHNVVPFQELSDIGNLEVDLLIVPELEKLSLLSGPVANQISFLQSYIENGGGLVLMGVVSSEVEENNNAINVMNEMLNAQIKIGEPVLVGTCTKSTNLLPGEYAESPNTIDNNNAIVYLTNGFVEGVKIIYYNSEKPADVAVAQFPLGKGSIVYFGWGWWNAFPVGAQDGGWLALLDETIELLSCSQIEASFEDEYIFSLEDTKSFMLSESILAADVKSCTAVEMRFSKTKFDCSDIGKVQTIQVDLVNENGTELTLNFQIEIIDPNNYCGFVNQEFSISSRVQNPARLPVKDVVLSLDSGDFVQEVVSDENGQFTSSVSAQETYTVLFEKDVSLEEQVSSRDLRMLSRHLLGIEVFTSPYQYIAADINGDGVLNVFDEILLKRILLFNLIGDEILAPNVQFVSKSYLFKPRVSPLHQNWDSIQGSVIDINHHDLDIILIKLGDIDSSL